MIRKADLTTIMRDTSLSAEARVIAVHVCLLGDGVHEISFGAFCRLLPGSSEREIRRALRDCAETGWLKRVSLGQGRSDGFEFSPGTDEKLSPDSPSTDEKLTADEGVSPPTDERLMDLAPPQLQSYAVSPPTAAKLNGAESGPSHAGSLSVVSPNGETVETTTTTTPVPNGTGGPPEKVLSEAQQLVNAVIDHGLAGEAPADYGKQASHAKTLLKKKPLEYWTRAAEVMEHLFPYSRGDPWDVFDLGRKAAKALAQSRNGAAVGGAGGAEGDYVDPDGYEY